jgi:RNA polymerase sigma-70 factor (ECF subfamily)
LGGVLEKYLLRHRPEASAEEIDGFLDALRADDVCLVVACERGDDAAWSDLMERFRATVLSAARGASANEGAADELAQSVWADLYGLRARADGSAAGKLAYYSGCGSLGGWLRAVVGQLAVDRHRKSARLVQTEEAADFDRLAHGQHEETDHFTVAAQPDPEHAFAERETSDAVADALADTLAGLDAEDRLLIKLYYFDDLRLREAGAVLGVHEATASRRLTRLHTEVRKRVESFLIAKRGWKKQEASRALADAATHLDTDLRRMLVGAENPAPSERREELYE